MKHSNESRAVKRFTGCEPFLCAVQLPPEADIGKITASIENGELTVRVPKTNATEDGHRTVEVQ